MREIKFRAYDTHTKIMLPIVDIIKFTKREGIYITRDSAYGVGINIQYQPHIELMQYTGIKDKNGKEIYEGDIFKIKYNKKDFMVWVEYSEKYAQFITRCEENILNDEPLGDLNEKHIEVIGNIYENPELLK